MAGWNHPGKSGHDLTNILTMTIHICLMSVLITDIATCWPDHISSAKYLKFFIQFSLLKFQG